MNRRGPLAKVEIDFSKFSESLKPLIAVKLPGVTKPSCLEFFPQSLSGTSPKEAWFIVGSYFLVPDALDDEEFKGSGETKNSNANAQGKRLQKKFGCLQLFCIDASTEGEEVKLHASLPWKSAVFDLHFLPGRPDIFALVTNKGEISVFNLARNPKDTEEPFQHIATNHVVEKEITFFAWYPNVGTNPPLLAATLEGGSFIIVRFVDWTFTKVEVLLDTTFDFRDYSHEENALCCAWLAHPSVSPGCSPMLFTGGEDGKLRLLTLDPVPVERSSKLLVSERPRQLRTFHPHEYGVTFILPLPVYSADTSQCFLLTGGYDDYVRVFTTHDSRPTAPKMGKPQVLAELKIEGAGWRLQFLENYSFPGNDSTSSLSKGNVVSSAQVAPFVFRVLASCHVAGAKILEITGNSVGDWTIKELGNVTIHDSMCYASGVVPAESEKGEKINPSLPRICVSTSWEDRLLCVWEWYPDRRKERESRPPY